MLTNISVDGLSSIILPPRGLTSDKLTKKVLPWQHFDMFIVWILQIELLAARTCIT